MKEHEILTIPEAAEYLRVSEKTVYKLLRSGKLRGAKVGKDWRVHRSVLEAFVLGEEGRDERQVHS